MDVVAWISRCNGSPRRTPARVSSWNCGFFGGLTIEEIATVLDVAPITVKRDWALARAWLYRELQAQIG